MVSDLRAVSQGVRVGLPSHPPRSQWRRTDRRSSWRPPTHRTATPRSSALPIARARRRARSSRTSRLDDIDDKIDLLFRGMPFGDFLADGADSVGTLGLDEVTSQAEYDSDGERLSGDVDGNAGGKSARTSPTPSPCPRSMARLGSLAEEVALAPCPWLQPLRMAETKHPSAPLRT